MGVVDPSIQTGYVTALVVFIIFLVRQLQKMTGSSIRIHDDECDKQLAKMREEWGKEREERIRLEERVRYLEEVNQQGRGDHR